MMPIDTDATWDDELAAAQAGDRLAFDRLLAPFRRELLAHCYRMLASIHDADDALQDTLLRSWRSLPGFEGRSSLRTWLHRIATNACLASIERHRRHVPVDPDDVGSGARRGSVVDADGPAWLEPFPYLLGEDSSPAAAIERRESMELAFVAAFQHLPAKERAALLLRDVLGFSANEAAAILETSVAAVNSRLQRARDRVRHRLPDRSQHATLRTIGDRRLQELVSAYVEAWERGDADAIVALVTDDATFSMPPRREAYRGTADIARFLRTTPLRYEWRLAPVEASGQLAFACYTVVQGVWTGHSVDVVSLRGDRIDRITAFLQPDLVRLAGLPPTIDD